MPASAPIGLYVHIPFCEKKCGYCDFNAYSGYREASKARYVDALCREIERRATGRTFATVFFGGGTPTQLPAVALVRILETVRAVATLTPDAEISLEANPGDATAAMLTTLRAAGFTRLSFGVQTFDDSLLKTIDRLHSGAQARDAVLLAQDCGFENLSLDLMFGLPRQTLPDWERALDIALALPIPHLSLYGLIVEEGTAFFARQERGRLPLPSEEVEAAMFARALEKTRAAGLRRYEISNYARPGFESRHNRIYWRNEPYLGVGAGAASYLDGVRGVNERLPSRYSERALADEDPTASTEHLTPEETLGETVMLGLRLAEGVDLMAFARRFGVRCEERFAAEIARLTDAGLLEIQENRMRLTEPRGLFLASEAMMAFV